MRHLIAYLLESSNYDLYHFTNVGNLINIIKDDEILGYPHYIYQADEDGNTIVDKQVHCISTTRMKCAKLGYPASMINKKIVRITLDTGRLKQKYRLKPWVYDESYRVPQQATKTKNGYEDWCSLFEAEERIIIEDGEGIKNFHKFIKQIDICSLTFDTDNSEEDFDILNKYCKKYNIRLKLYHTVKDFNYGK